MPVSFSGEYRDAAGYLHARFAVVTGDGKRYMGEAIYDGKLERTILDDDVLRLPRDIVIEVKRGMKEFAAKNGTGIDTSK
ncbi:MAG: hypothetical protein HUU29_00630 [Planctomycetaceae bacterium]|nr:hypothetical protein [Planctomycetaceae bacterium]